MGFPRDRTPRVCPGAPASTLVVKEQIVLLAEVQHLRQQIPVVGTRSTMKNQQLPGTWPTVLRPVKGCASLSRESFFPRRGDRLGHGGLALRAQESGDNPRLTGSKVGFARHRPARLGDKLR